MYRRIRDLREDRDLLQKDLAAYLQCSQVCYSYYEMGKRDIPTNILLKLADLLHPMCNFRVLPVQLLQDLQQRSAVILHLLRHGPKTPHHDLPPVKQSVHAVPHGIPVLSIIIRKAEGLLDPLVYLSAISAPCQIQYNGVLSNIPKRIPVPHHILPLKAIQRKSHNGHNWQKASHHWNTVFFLSP